MEISLLLGIAGMLLILAAFVMDEFYKKWNQDTLRYNFANLLGSGFLLYYAYALASWPFLILNGVWFVTALVKLVKISK